MNVQNNAKLSSILGGDFVGGEVTKYNMISYFLVQWNLRKAEWYYADTSVSKFRAFLLIVTLRGHTVSLCVYGQTDLFAT